MDRNRMLSSDSDSSYRLAAPRRALLAARVRSQ